jgi:hypothetical protein
MIGFKLIISRHAHIATLLFNALKRIRSARSRHNGPLPQIRWKVFELKGNFLVDAPGLEPWTSCM